MLTVALEKPLLIVSDSVLRSSVEEFDGGNSLLHVRHGAGLGFRECRYRVTDIVERLGDNGEVFCGQAFPYLYGVLMDALLSFVEDGFLF